MSDIRRLHQELNSWTEVLALDPMASVDQYVPDVPAAYQRLKAGVGQNSDVLMRYLQVPSLPGEQVLVVCLDGISETQMVDQDIIEHLLKTTTRPDLWNETAVTPVDVTQATTWTDILQKLVEGNTLIFAPRVPFVWVVDTVKYPQRSIGRPQTEMAVRGSEEAFTEVLVTQKTQIRHRLRSPALRFQDYTIGVVQRTKLSVAYLEGIANPALVTTVEERLKAIDVDGVVTITQIGGLIRDHPRSIFPTIRETERVDMAVWRLLEGAVVILMDGDPFVLIAPAPLIEFYRTVMDYSSSWVDTSFVRIIRFMGWLLGIYLPAIFVALAQVNPSILPTSLFIIFQGSNVGLPFPPSVQVVLMILVIETLREAALRLPKVLSTTIGTVGAIVVGTAVVKAGLVDTQIIVIMTLTALSLFSTPVYELTGTWRAIGFLMLVAALYFGILGIALVTIGVIGVLVDMKSFGTPYLEPWAPFRVADWKDGVIRMPWTTMDRRWTGPRSPRRWWRQHETVSTHPRLQKGKMGSRP
ncbi:spore germination protein [Sulfobacillus sp. DSM 109850]|uniref:Spore germination protein n=2 Tax=Sulfobacillus harzensis TaxID=2729629 RepID=A0A7Y0Q1C6_9FIRM|nr:spore germination protein [Sulfobacillus harzensis]